MRIARPGPEERAHETAIGAARTPDLRFAVAAYNCGPGNAIKGFQAGDIDKFTTGGNYSRDVFSRRTQLKKLLT